MNLSMLWVSFDFQTYDLCLYLFDDPTNIGHGYGDCINEPWMLHQCSSWYCLFRGELAAHPRVKKVKFSIYCEIVLIFRHKSFVWLFGVLPDIWSFYIFFLLILPCMLWVFYEVASNLWHIQVKNKFSMLWISFWFSDVQPLFVVIWWSIVVWYST